MAFNQCFLKTPEQLYREGAAIRDALKVLSRKKKLSNLKFHSESYGNEGCIDLVVPTKSIDTPKSAGKSYTRGVVADILKMKESAQLPAQGFEFIGNLTTGKNQ